MLSPFRNCFTFEQGSLEALGPMWMGRASDGRVVDESGEKRRVQGRTAKSLNTNGIRRRTASTKVPFRAMRSNRGSLEAICLRAPRRSGGQWSSVAHPAISPVLVDRPRPIVLDPRSLTSPHRPRLAPNHSTAPARSIPARYILRISFSSPATTLALPSGNCPRYPQITFPPFHASPSDPPPRWPLGSMSPLRAPSPRTECSQLILRNHPSMTDNTAC